MKCVNCGRDIVDNSIFCNWCGTKQIKDKKSDDITSVPKPTLLPSGKYRIQLRAEKQSFIADTEEEVTLQALAYRNGLLELKKNPERITLTKAIDRYIESRTNVLSPESIRIYKQYQRLRFQELMKMQVGDITKDIAQKSVNDSLQHYSAKAVQTSWGFINTVMHEITGEFLDVKVGQVVCVGKQALSPEQLKVFCKAIHGTDIEIGALIELCSLRRSELMHLKWKDIDLENRIIHVSGATVYDENLKLVDKDTNKNKTSRRDVPIKMQQLYDVLASAKGEPEEKVVPFYPNTMARRINKVCRENGLPEVGNHGLRKTFASLEAYLGNTSKSTMKQGGWSDDRTMLNIYTKVFDLDVARATERTFSYYNDIYDGINNPKNDNENEPETNDFTHDLLTKDC